MAAPQPLLSDNAMRVLKARYLRRDAERRIIETPGELFERVARGVAHAELLLGNARQAAHWQARFQELLATLDFLPNSPTLMNAGTPMGQLSACFVLPVEDSIEGIFDALKQMALVQRTGGGTGFSFSRLRPRGASVGGGAGQTPGPVSCFRVFDAATEHIKLGGRRRGANMAVLRVDHPDVREFIAAKLDGSLPNFNISVGVTDAFMRAAAEDQPFDLLDPRTGRRVDRTAARALFTEIIEAAWQTGDPGLLFLDAVNRTHPLRHRGEIEGTNPCGEVPLLPHESCNLGSINLAHMIREQRGRVEVDWDKLQATTFAAVRLLDDVVEVNRYPSPEIDEGSRGSRKIGVGVMGFAELLVRLGIPYDSDAAVRAADELMRKIAEAAREASRELAAERGVYPFWQGSRHDQEGLRVRNATVTAIAPTGTISIIAGTSAGIEPLFALAYRRTHVLGGETLMEVNPLLRNELERRRIDPREVIEAVKRTGRLQEAEAPAELRRLFVTAHEVPPERHLEIQAAFQRHVDNSVSKTVNLPESITPEEIGQIYRRAWELGLKGVTVYRYHSKPAQVLELGVGEESYHFEHAARCDPSECRV
ncbi:MAG: adenosylcobalamin-dependent ribonucleoside-diphosphate reductase [Gemmatimonadetes bacterium]|nr:adenosylcobalamin-dependent ribonucleoside-diphosphate reductase [Gemmatimonadota bacterium]